ncbi:MAG: hypothetical protein CM15mV27_1350 [Caudoviricetes sp.]|nr:MAG: hypothetical protein CM15mV27_1350 [Caudoviricetes sp.]
MKISSYSVQKTCFLLYQKINFQIIIIKNKKGIKFWGKFSNKETFKKIKGEKKALGKTLNLDKWG